MERRRERECCWYIQGYLGARNLRGGETTTTPHKEIYLSIPSSIGCALFFILLLPSSSYFLVVRPSVRLCQFHCRPFLFPPSPLAHFFRTVCNLHPTNLYKTHARAKCQREETSALHTHGRTDRRLFFFFLWGNDDDVEAKNLWPFWCSALKTSSPVT